MAEITRLHANVIGVPPGYEAKVNFERGPRGEELGDYAFVTVTIEKTTSKDVLLHCDVGGEYLHKVELTP